MREVENFLEEIAVMKKVTSGECCHVVQMVGCVSTALPLALALEFVPFGDLLSYLKYWRQKVYAVHTSTCKLYSVWPGHITKSHHSFNLAIIILINIRRRICDAATSVQYHQNVANSKITVHAI